MHDVDHTVSVCVTASITLLETAVHFKMSVNGNLLNKNLRKQARWDRRFLRECQLKHGPGVDFIAWWLIGARGRMKVATICTTGAASRRMYSYVTKLRHTFNILHQMITLWCFFN